MYNMSSFVFVGTIDLSDTKWGQTVIQGQLLLYISYY